MEHLSEVLRILDGALSHDVRRASDYANLLAEKLEKEGQARQAQSIRAAMAKRPVRSFSAAGLRSLPIDEATQSEMLDIVDHSRTSHPVITHPFAEEQLADFLAGIAKFDEWHAKGVSVPNRLLITGPPGTGKTTLAHLTAERLGLPLATVRSDTLVSSLLGQTSRNIREVFEFAALHPCILFLDEFDALAKMRSDSREIGELQRVVIALLQNIDALPENTIVLAATNHPELLDRAIWRRFPYQILLNLPEGEQRDRLWRMYLREIFEMDEADWAKLVEVSDGLSPAAISAAASDAVRHSLTSGHSGPPLPFILRRLARTLWNDYSLFSSSVSEMKALRDWQPRVFSMRVLADMFGVSTRKVTNAVHEESQ